MASWHMETGRSGSVLQLRSCGVCKEALVEELCEAFRLHAISFAIA